MAKTMGSPRELAPLPDSPGSPSAREALRRALNGDNETPNLALAPLRWNIEKERRARGAASRCACQLGCSRATGWRNNVMNFLGFVETRRADGVKWCAAVRS